MDYVIAGNVMIDTVRFPDGRHSDGDHIGGPATFAYSGECDAVQQRGGRLP